MKNIFLTLLISLISSGLYGQARPVKHLRLGVRIGAPNVFTGHIEYVTHFWEDHIAFSADFMSLSPTIDDVKLSIVQIPFKNCWQSKKIVKKIGTNKT